MRTLTISVLLVSLSAVAVLAAEEKGARVYELRTYYAPAGKLDELHARFREHTLKLFEKHGITSIGYWVSLENPENKLVYLISFPSPEAHAQAWKEFRADPQWTEVKAKTEANGPIVSKIESVLLAPTDYSPEVKPVAQGERVVELRTYTAAPGKLENLNARFRDHTVKLFEKHGMTNVGYWVPLEGQPGAGSTLVYMLAHKSQEAAKASFDAFRQDADWVAARKASEEKAGGPLTVPDGVKSVFMKPTDYSPLR
jgi:hypothetical protein